MRKIIALISVIILIVSLVGCNKPIENPNNNGSDSVTSTNKEVKNPKLTYLDKTWKDIGQLSEGLIAVQDKSNGLWGYIDTTGKEIIKAEYYDAYPFSEGLAAVKMSTGFYNFIDKTSKIITSKNYTSVSPKFVDGIMKVTLNNKEIYIDKNGSELENKPKNIVGNLPGYGEEQNGCRDIFNYSTKYVIKDDLDYNKEGQGLYVANVKGETVFQQNKIQGMDNSLNFKLGISDDYIVIYRNVNGIQSMALYDFNGNIVIDYKYKEIYPISKDLFIVKNNGDNCALIDKTDKEIVPFSLNIPHFNNCNTLNMVYSSIKETGSLFFDIKDEHGNKKSQYFDFSDGKIKDTFTIDNRNAMDYALDNGKSGIYYKKGNNITVFNSKGEVLGSVESVSQSNFNVTNRTNSLNIKDFLKINIIPTWNKERTGMTLVIIK